MIEIFFVVENTFDILFIRNDPRLEGFSGDVREGIELDRYDHVNRDHEWGLGCLERLGVLPFNEKMYRTFKDGAELDSFGYREVRKNMFGPMGSISEYARVTDQKEWCWEHNLTPR